MSRQEKIGMAQGLRRIGFSISAFILATPIVLLLLKCAEEKKTTQEETIKIGSILPLTGELAGFGETMNKAIRLAVSEINEQGGVLGKKLEIVPCDDGTSAEGAGNCFQKLANSGIKFIIGPATSSGVINGVCGGASNNVCQPLKDKKILIISPSATSPLISNLDDGGFIWRTPPSDALQGKALAEYICEDHQDVKKVSVIYRDDPYGRGLANAFKTNFQQKCSGTVPDSAFVSYPEKKESGFQDEIDKLLNVNPDGIVLITFVSDGNNLLSDLKTKIGSGTPLKLFGCDGNKDKDISGGTAKDFIKGRMWGTAPTPPKDDPDYGKFVQVYKNKYGDEPSIFNDNTYDAVYVIAMGIESAGEYDPEKVKDKLIALTNGGEKVKPVSAGGRWNDIVQKIKSGADIDYKGVSGKLDFDQNGDVKGGVYIIWKIVDTEGKESDFQDVKIKPITE